MDRRSDELQRIFVKLMSRYGIEDLEVQSIKATLDAHEQFKVRYPIRLIPRSAKYDFRSAARQCYHRSTEDSCLQDSQAL